MRWTVSASSAVRRRSPEHTILLGTKRSHPFGPRRGRVARPTGNHEIWKVDANPVGLHTGVQLTTDGGENSRPSWAPDGHHFVYQHLNGHEQLWSADDSGPIVPALVYSDPNADALTPVYDPGDQTKIVFVSNAGGHDEIVLLDTTANTLTNLSRLSIGQTGCTTPVGSPFGASCSTPTAFNDDKPDVASDSGRIVFQSTRPLTVGGAVQTKPQIWSFVYNHGGAGLGTNPMTLFGGTAATSGTGFGDTNPAYSPQNDNVVFQRTTGAGDIESFSMGVSNENRGNGAPTNNSYITGAAPSDITPNWGNKPGQDPQVPEVPYTVMLLGGAVLAGGVALTIHRRRGHHDPTAPTTV